MQRKKMWINLKTHFKASNQDQLLNATAKEYRYYSAANANHIDQFEDAHKQ